MHVTKEHKFGIEALEYLMWLRGNGGTLEEIEAFLFGLGGLKCDEKRREFSISIWGKRLWYDGRRLCGCGSGSRGRITKSDLVFYNWIVSSPSGGPIERAVFDRTFPEA